MEYPHVHGGNRNPVGWLEESEVTNSDFARQTEKTNGILKKGHWLTFWNWKIRI
jgi:hypothetical protein